MSEKHSKVSFWEPLESLKGALQRGLETESESHPPSLLFRAWPVERLRIVSFNIFVILRLLAIDPPSDGH